MKPASDPSKPRQSCARALAIVFVALAGWAVPAATLHAADGASVGTTGDDRGVMLGDVLDLIPWSADTGKLSSASEAARDAVPPAAQGTFDAVHQQVIDRSEALCDELDSAPQERVDELSADYTAFRQEEEARLDTMKQNEAKLDTEKKEIEAADAAIDDWDYMPDADPRIVAAEATLKDARTAKEKLDFQRSDLIKQNAELIKRRSAFADASQRLRTANAEIARLEGYLAKVDSGEIKLDTMGGISGSMGARSTRTEVVGQLNAAKAAQAQALTDAGNALLMGSPPADLAALGAKAGPLENDWQGYQAQLADVQAKIAAAEKEVQAALKARDKARADVRADRDKALAEQQKDLAKRRETYALAVEDLIMERAAALLSFQLYSNVWDCIGTRQAALDKEKDEAEMKRADQVAAAHKFGDVDINGVWTRTCTNKATGKTGGTDKGTFTVRIVGQGQVQGQWFAPGGWDGPIKGFVDVDGAAKWTLQVGDDPYSMNGRVRRAADGRIAGEGTMYSDVSDFRCAGTWIVTN